MFYDVFYIFKKLKINVIMIANGRYIAQKCG